MITENKKKNLFLKKIRGDDTKKIKRLTEIQVFKKMFAKNESNSYLNQSTIEKSLLIHSQIILIKFVLNQI